MRNSLDNRMVEQRLLAAGLRQLAAIQRVVSIMVPGSLDPTNESVTETCFALAGEVFEMAQAIGWKSWKSNPPMTEDQVQVVAEEFADILAFLGRLMILVRRRTGLEFEELAAAYMGKSRKNIARFMGVSKDEVGYDLPWIRQNSPKQP